MKSGQNKSSAVMQQRAAPKDHFDFFPTPPWATRALCNFIEGEIGCLDGLSCWEPACGAGDMAAPLKEYSRLVFASDIFDYGYGEVRDFLFPGSHRRADWVITNPPFKLAEDFILKGLEHADVGVAVLVRCAFLEGVGRYERLFRDRPPAFVLQFCERVVMHQGKLSPDGSTATAYAWVIWVIGRSPPRFGWIPPCRRKLERPGDYEPKKRG